MSDKPDNIPAEDLAMAPDVARQFASLKRQSSREINAKFLSSVNAKIDTDPDAAEHWMVKAAICCRTGDFAAARDSYQQYMTCNGQPWDAGGSIGLVTPPDLFKRSGFQVPPVAVVDGFLGAAQMEILHRDALDVAPELRDAKVFYESNEMDLSKRRTSVCKTFTSGQTLLRNAVEARLDDIRQGFGIAAFERGMHSVKLTYHGDGGFFLPHRDSHEPLKAGTRALTWLYYFGSAPKKYDGGDLYLFDSQTPKARYKLSSFIKVEPVIDRLVVFPSWMYHAVSPLEMLPDASFADGRFAISGHMHVHKSK